MEIWKEIPLWFNVNNYRDSIKFTASEWLDEIAARKYYLNILKNPEEHSKYLFESDNLSEDMEEARRFFNVVIRKQPLVSKERDLNDPSSEEMIKDFKNLRLSKSEYKHMFSSVKELNEASAYSFFLDSEKKLKLRTIY